MNDAIIPCVPARHGARAFLGGLRAPTFARPGAVVGALHRLDGRQPNGRAEHRASAPAASAEHVPGADSFLARGHWVVICDVKDPADAVAALRAKHASVPNAKIEGCVCDVSDASRIVVIATFAKEKLGTIHYWINNAGINGGRRPFTSVPLGVVEAVVKSFSSSACCCCTWR